MFNINACIIDYQLWTEWMLNPHRIWKRKPIYDTKF